MCSDHKALMAFVVFVLVGIVTFFQRGNEQLFFFIIGAFLWPKFPHENEK
jgi:hypothetical protein